MKMFDEPVEAYAYMVLCDGKDNLGKVTFGIPIKKIRNNDNACRYCPVRSKCKRRKGKKLHFYSTLQINPEIKLPIPVIIRR